MPTLPSEQKPCLLYLVTEDWYFLSHRLPLARAALREGYRVAVATRINSDYKHLLDEGFEIYPLPWKRGSINPIKELLFIFKIIKLYRRVRPTLAHHIAIKPVIYGTLASKFLAGVTIVNTIAGLGAVFTLNDARSRLLRNLLSILFRLVLNGRRNVVIFQNHDDPETLRRCGALNNDANIEVVRGSGVDIAHFTPMPEPTQSPLRAAMVSRMLIPKGVLTAVEAAKILSRNKAPVHLYLVGAPDPESSVSVTENELRASSQSGYVTWQGHIADVREVWRNAAIAVFPSSYGEGLPKTLLEAAACKRPLIATDVPGCREIVIDEISGIRIPVNDPRALAEAIAALAADPVRRERLGAGARRLVEEQFSTDIINRKTIDLYNRTLATRSRGS